MNRIVGLLQAEAEKITSFFWQKNINKILNKTLKKFINCYSKYNNISSTFHNNSKKKNNK